MQGVDLSNLVIGDNETHAVVDAIAAAKTILEDGKKGDLSKQCDVIAEECSKGLPERLLATSSDGYRVLLRCAETEGSESHAMRALAAMTDGNPDPLEEDGFKAILGGLNSGEAMSLATLDCLLNCCVRHETNRQNFLRNGVLAHLDKLAERHPIKVAMIWQAMVQDDDIRVPFGKAHDTAREIVEEHDALKVLTKLIGEAAAATAQDRALLLSALSSVTVRNEYCQTVVDEGGLKCVLVLLLEPAQSKEVVAQSLKLVKTLAGNDNVKKYIAESEGIPIIVSAITNNMVSRVY